MGIAVAFVVVVGVAAAVVGTEFRGHGAAVADHQPISDFSKLPFTADMTIVTKIPEGHHFQPKSQAGKTPTVTTIVYHGKMYAGPHALRTDIQMQRGMTASVIIRYDKGVTWILTPHQGYIQTPIEERTDLLTALRDPNAHVRKEDLGPAQVGSYACEKYQVQVTENSKPESGWIWVARQKDLHGFIVKAENGKTKDSVVFSNISLVPPKPSVFDLPPGYKELTTPKQGAGGK
jgi:hypothetical protein